jgi:beta-lactamase superfamily II metal-dependent hydrolase
MITVDMLPAKYGDALLVTWGTKKAPHRMLIDAGLGSAFPAVKSKLESFDGDVDLFVVTHVDTDHIGGAVKLLRDTTLVPRIRQVWFNGHLHLEKFNKFLGPLDGERLTELIRTTGLPWNSGWEDPVDDCVGGPVVCRDDPPVVELPGTATLTVVGPTPQKLADLLPKWREVIANAGLKEGVEPKEEEPEKTRRPMLGLSLSDLAESKFKGDDAEANGSSIAFVFEHDGTRILFGADAHEETLLESLGKLAPAGERYRLDACKLPHHGSRRNVSKALVQALECDQWWFSSSGARFHHPNDEAIARVIRFGGPKPKLVANYASERWQKFTADYPPADHGYDLTLPTPGTEGITVTLL